MKKIISMFIAVAIALAGAVLPVYAAETATGEANLKNLI